MAVGHARFCDTGFVLSNPEAIKERDHKLWGHNLLFIWSLRLGKRSAKLFQPLVAVVMLRAMAILPRAVAPDCPHHITQRGNRRQTVFFSDDDDALHGDLRAQHCRGNNVAIRAWCLMSNHIHLIAVPSTEAGLAKAIGDT